MPAIDWSDFASWCLGTAGRKPETLQKTLERARFMHRGGFDWTHFASSPAAANAQARAWLARTALRRKRCAAGNHTRAMSLVAKYLADQDPRFEGVKWKKPPEAATQPVGFTAEQVAQLRAYTHDVPETRRRRRALVYLCLTTGLRRSEISQVRVEDLDEDQLALRVDEPAKNGRRRLVPLPMSAWSPRGDLQTWIRTRPRVRSDPGALWTRTYRGRVDVLDKTTLRREFWRMRTELGFLISFNRFRHWHAREILEAGVNLRVLQDLYGHANISSTAHYLQMDYAGVRRELARACVPGYRQHAAV